MRAANNLLAYSTCAWIQTPRQPIDPGDADARLFLKFIFSASGYLTCCPLVRFSRIGSIEGSIEDAARDGHARMVNSAVQPGASWNSVNASGAQRARRLVGYHPTKTNQTITMLAWPVARSIFDAPLCERSERADNKLDKSNHNLWVISISVHVYRFTV